MNETDLVRPFFHLKNSDHDDTCEQAD